MGTSRKALTEFTYRAVHDLKEPLFVCSTAIDSVTGRGELSPASERLLERASGSMRRMQQLIKDLLVYIDAVGGDPVLKRVDANAVVERAITHLSVAIEETGAKISHGPLPTVMGDEERLGLVFRHLLENSLKFRRDVAPEVSFSAERQRAEWRFTVTDNGIGIEADYLERVFEPFERLHEKGAYPGNGIGLTLCRQIIEAHGGSIFIESEPGKGTTVRFTLFAAG